MNREDALPEGVWATWLPSSTKLLVQVLNLLAKASLNFSAMKIITFLKYFRQSKVCIHHLDISITTKH